MRALFFGCVIIAICYVQGIGVKKIKTLPKYCEKNCKVSKIADYGNGHYVIRIENATKKGYEKYLNQLEYMGFKKHSDNGKDAMEGNILTASYRKKEMVVTVSHAIHVGDTYISASERIELSDHLVRIKNITKDEEVKSQTSLHMMELNNNGACFVIQLKNGHFVIHDGGHEYDAPYLLDYLESLTSEGEKPVVEGWFISHAHSDHHGALLGIMNRKKWRDRIYVDGIYFVEPPLVFVRKTKYDTYQDMKDLTNNYHLLKNSEHQSCKLYRPQLGQRYYFCDIYIDVVLTPEQFILDASCKKDFNETSVWFMNHIEGQKILLVGDTNHTGMRTAMRMLDKAYFQIDVYAVSHHGVNVYDYFTDILDVKTLLYSNWRIGSLWQDGSKYARTKENKQLIQNAREAYSHESGTVVLKFPYVVGEAYITGKTRWIYNGGRNFEVFE